MVSFLPKIGWKRRRKRENKNYRYVSFQPDGSQKIPKKFKKIKNTVMYSFQAKIGWKMPRKRKSKNYRSVSFQPDEKQKIKKNSKKIQKIKKYRYVFFSSQNRFDKDERGRK